MQEINSFGEGYNNNRCVTLFALTLVSVILYSIHDYYKMCILPINHVKVIEYKYNTLYFMVKNTPAPIPSKANA